MTLAASTRKFVPTSWYTIIPYSRPNRPASVPTCRMAVAKRPAALAPSRTRCLSPDSHLLSWMQVPCYPIRWFLIGIRSYPHRESIPQGCHYGSSTMLHCCLPAAYANSCIVVAARPCLEYSSQTVQIPHHAGIPFQQS